MQDSESTLPSDFWTRIWKSGYFRAGKDPKGTLQMRKLRLIYFLKATQLFINNSSTALASVPRGREPQGSLLGEICQQLATNLLTGDLSSFGRNGTEVTQPIRKGHKAWLSVSENWLPLWLAVQGKWGARVMGRGQLQWFLKIQSIPHFKDAASQAALDSWLMLPDTLPRFAEVEDSLRCLQYEWWWIKHKNHPCITWKASESSSSAKLQFLLQDNNTNSDTSFI